MTDRLLLFIPCFNCEDQIGRVIHQVTLEHCPKVAEILVVDNQSGDRTAYHALAALSDVQNVPWVVCRNRANYGLGGSHKIAFRYAVSNSFSHVIVLHGDDQARLTDLTKPLEQGLHRANDSLLGARFMKGSSRVGYSAFRTVGNLALNAVCGLLTRCRILDQGAGLNIYKTEYLKSGFYEPFDDSLIFPNMMFLHGAWAKSAFAFFPISWREEDQKSNAKAVRQAVNVLRLAYLGPKALRSGQARDPSEYAFDVLGRGDAP